MKRLNWILAILVSGMFLLSGCGDSVMQPAVGEEIFVPEYVIIDPGDPPTPEDPPKLNLPECNHPGHKGSCKAQPKERVEDGKF